MRNDMYQKAKDYLLRVGAAAVITLTPNIAMATNSSKTPEVRKDGIEAFIGSGSPPAQVKPKGGIIEGTGKFIGDYLDNSFNKYKSLDVYVYGDISDEERLGQILHGVAHFPGHYVADGLRTVEAAFIKVPQEAMRRAKAEKELKQVKAQVQPPKKKEYNPILGIIQAPLDVIWRAGEYGAEVLTDSARFLGHYSIITVGGALEKVTKEPLDFAAETGASYAIGKWIHDETKGGGGKPKPGEPPPPVEPSPPPPAFPKQPALP